MNKEIRFRRRVSAWWLIVGSSLLASAVYYIEASAPIHVHQGWQSLIYMFLGIVLSIGVVILLNNPKEGG